MNILSVKLFIKLILRFDLASALFRSFELTVIKGALQNLKVNEPILDIGCAEGYVARELFKNKEIIGLDYETGYLLAAKRLRFYKYLVRADARKMPFKDNSLPFLFSNSVIEHIEELDDVLGQAKRILKPDGIFLFTVPNNNFSTSLFFYRLFKVLVLNKLALSYAKERNKRLKHFHAYTLSEWQEITQRAGLKVALIKNYSSARILMLWDLIAASQFILRKIFALPLKIVFIRDILLFISYMVKIVAALFVLAFCVFFGDGTKDGCATLIVARK